VSDSLQAAVQGAGERPDPATLFARLRPRLAEGREHIRRALQRHEAKLSDFDLFEVNEAFAPQYLAVEKDLGLPRDRTNVDGGAIAVGHPLAASGARITAHLLYEMRRRGVRRGIGSACIGGGQGIALLLETA